MENKIYHRRLIALVFGALCIPTVLVVISYVNILTTGELQGVKFGTAEQVLYALARILLVLWLIALGLIPRWEWVRKIVMAIALVVLVVTAQFGVALMKLDMSPINSETLDVINRQVNPHTLLYIIVLVLAAVIIWALAVIYFALAAGQARQHELT